MEPAELEELFLLGRFEDALAQSRRIINECNANEQVDTQVMNDNEERVVAVFLQSAFELQRMDEMPLAAEFFNRFDSVSFKLTLQWCKALLASKCNSVSAIDVISQELDKRRNRLMGKSFRDQQKEEEEECDEEDKSTSSLESFTSQQQLEKEYQVLLDLLLFQVLLDREAEQELQARITSDTLLDESCQKRFLQQLRSHFHPTVEPTRTKDSNEESARGHLSTCDSTASTTTDCPWSRASELNLLAIGGTALALSVVAVGFVRFRPQLRKAWDQVGKALNDAKSALL